MFQPFVPVVRSVCFKCDVQWPMSQAYYTMPCWCYLYLLCIWDMRLVWLSVALDTIAGAYVLMWVVAKCTRLLETKGLAHEAPDPAQIVQIAEGQPVPATLCSLPECLRPDFRPRVAVFPSQVKFLGCVPATHLVLMSICGVRAVVACRCIQGLSPMSIAVWLYVVFKLYGQLRYDAYFCSLLTPQVPL